MSCSSDKWIIRGKDRCCEYCGSMHHEDLIALCEAKPIVGDKGNKVPVKEEPKKDLSTTTGGIQSLSDKEIEQQLDQLFAEKSPNFEKVYEKILKIIERRPITQRNDIYINLLNSLLKGIVGPAMINRQLFNGARDFWRNLVSGVYYK